MVPCLSQVTTLPAAFDAELRGYSQVGVPAVELWLTKLEAAVAAHSGDQVRQWLAASGLRVGAAGVQGGIFEAPGAARGESLGLLRRRLELCRQLGVPTLVVLADFADGSRGAPYAQAIDSLRDASDLAAESGIRLALEFQARSAWCNNLSSAASLVERVERPNVGLCFDVFHYYCGPSKLEDLALVSRANLFHVQLCDLAGLPRELARDSDRVLPGDGDFQLAPIVDHLHTIGYDGCVSVELMNPIVWQLPPEHVAHAALESLRRLLDAPGERLAPRSPAG